MVFITVVESVYSAVRTDSLYKANYVYYLKGYWILGRIFWLLIKNFKSIVIRAPVLWKLIYRTLSGDCKFIHNNTWPISTNELDFAAALSTDEPTSKVLHPLHWPITYQLHSGFLRDGPSDLGFNSSFYSLRYVRLFTLSMAQTEDDSKDLEPNINFESSGKLYRVYW